MQTTANIRWRFLLQLSGLFLGLTYLFLFNGTNDNFLDLTFLRINAGLITIFVVGWLILGTRGSTGMSRWITLFLGVCLAATLLSIDPRRSIDQLYVAGGAAFLFFLLAEFRARGLSLEAFQKSMLMVGFLVALFLAVGAAQWYAGWRAATPGSWLPDISYRLTLPNLMVDFLNGIVILAVCMFLNSRSKPGKVFLVIYGLFLVALIYLTGSRGGWLGLAAGLVAALILGWLNGIEILRSLWKRITSTRWLQILLAAILLSGLMFAVWLFFLRPVAPNQGPASSARSQYWPVAIQTFLAHPILGTGPFTFSSALLNANSVPPFNIFVHAHNAYLNLLAETGILGFAAFLALVFFTGRRLFQRMKAARPEERVILTAAGAAAVAILAHGVTDCFHVEPMGFWVVTLFLGAALGEPAQTTTTKPKLLQRPWWALLLVVYAWAQLAILTSFQNGVAAANLNQWDQAVQLFTTTVQRDPGSAAAWEQLGLAQAARAAEQNDEAMLNEAIATFEKTVEMDPDWALNHANLGALYAAAGRQDEAIAQWEEAVRLSPGGALYHLNLGILYEQSGRESYAMEQYNEVLALRADLEPADHFWSGTELRVATYNAWMKDRAAVEEKSLAVLEAESAANPNSVEASLALAEGYLMDGQMEVALNAVTRSELAMTDNSWLRLDSTWLRAEIAAAQGKYDDAEYYGEAALNAFRMQGLDGPGTIEGQAYNWLAFRRPAMAMELVPQMQVFTLPDRWIGRMWTLREWYGQQGKTDKAEEVYQELLEMIPDFEP